MKKLDVFALSYWTAAVVQFVGTLAVFYVIGGGGLRGALYSVSGALCLEVVILGINAYGVTRTGPFRSTLLILSLILISISCAVQIADMSLVKQPEELKAQMGPMLGFMLIVVPSTPSIAMAITTAIKFLGDKGDIEAMIIKRNIDVTEIARAALEEERNNTRRLQAQLEEARSRPIVQQAFLNPGIQLDVSAIIKQKISEGFTDTQVASHLLEGVDKASPDYKRLKTNYIKRSQRCR